MAKDYNAYVTLVNSGYPFTYNVFVEADKELHHWHGGEVLTIKGSLGFDFMIEASGDVRFSLFDRTSGKILLDIIDKKNEGKLFWGLRKFIDNDDELTLLFSEVHPKYYAAIENNNWWQCVVSRNGIEQAFSFVLSGDTLTEAVEEVLDSMMDIIRDAITEEELLEFASTSIL